MWYMYGRRVANHGLPYLAMTIGPLAQQWANHESCHRSHATLCSSSPSRNKGIHHLFHHPRTRTSAPGRQTWWKWMLVAIVCDHQLPQVDCSVLEERADGCPLRWRDARNHLRCASTPILFLTASCQRQCFSRDIKDCQKSKKNQESLTFILLSMSWIPDFVFGAFEHVTFREFRWDHWVPKRCCDIAFTTWGPGQSCQSRVQVVNRMTSE